MRTPMRKNWDRFRRAPAKRGPEVPLVLVNGGAWNRSGLPLGCAPHRRQTMRSVTRPNQSTRGAMVPDQPWIDHSAAACSDLDCLLGRILIGGIFVQSGFGKLMGLDAFAAGLARNGIPGAV